MKFGIKYGNWFLKLQISGAFCKHPGGYNPWSTKRCPWYAINSQCHAFLGWNYQNSSRVSCLHLFTSLHCRCKESPDLNSLQKREGMHTVGFVCTYFLISSTPLHFKCSLTLISFSASNWLSGWMLEKTAEVVPLICFWWVPAFCSCQSQNCRSEVYGDVWCF